MIATIDIHHPASTQTSNPLADLVHVLCQFAASWPPDTERREHLVWTAVEHGRYRRAEGDAEAEIFEDYERLRDCLWRGIRKHPRGPGIASELILRIDSAISLAVAAALRGYYEDVISRSGDWPAAVDRLLWDWRMTGSLADDI